MAAPAPGATNEKRDSGLRPESLFDVVRRGGAGLRGWFKGMEACAGVHAFLSMAAGPG